MATRRVKMPQRLVFDSSAFIAALEPEPTTPGDIAAVSLVEFLQRRGEPINLTTLTVAEVLTNGPPDPVFLRGHGIVQLPFDSQSAEFVASHIPVNIVKDMRDHDTRRRPLQYWKTDRLIIGCILRWRGTLVTADKTQKLMADRVGLEAWHVEELVDQLGLGAVR